VKRRAITSAIAGWALWRLLGPEVPPRFEGIQRRPGTIPGRTVTAGRHEFFVRELGEPDAPPIVLVHGWLYDSFATWHRVAPELALSHRVVMPDLRNHGKTDRIRTRFEISDAADELAVVLDTMDVIGVPVVGYSMGGLVAQELALRHPGVASRLVLAATAAAPVQRPRSITVPGLVVGRALSRIDRTLLPRIAYRYLMMTGVFAREEGEWLWQSLLDRDTDLYYESGFAILRFDATDRIRQLKIPVGSIIPTRDQLIPPDHQRETAAIIGADITEIEGARHEAVLTHPGEITKAITEFVSNANT
jgi:pimeloyl-ACP methyl ester carboxylesterase